MISYIAIAVVTYIVAMISLSVASAALKSQGDSLTEETRMVLSMVALLGSALWFVGLPMILIAIFIIGGTAITKVLLERLSKFVENKYINKDNK